MHLSIRAIQAQHLQKWFWNFKSHYDKTIAENETNDKGQDL